MAILFREESQLSHSTVVAFLFLMGITGIALGIWIRLGKNRAGYLVPNYYVLLPRNMRYALPFGGVMMILIGISLLIPNPEAARIVWIVGVVPLWIIQIAIVVWAPNWLKPQWEQWLEANHSDIVELLIREARQTPNWAKTVSTQEGLEDWVAKVRRKYGAFASPRPHHYRPGDRVLWSSTRYGRWSVEAIVEKVTEKRVQIRYEEGGETKISYVPPHKLKLKGTDELLLQLFED